MSTRPESDDGYIDVDTRLASFLTRYPDGALGPLDPNRPYRVERIEGTDAQGRSVVTTFLVYTATAYRYPDDSLPGIGNAWTPFPGRSEFTHDTELQNVETAAWGRAIRAVMPIERQPLATRPADRIDADPLSPRRIKALRARAEKSATPELLKLLAAEVDEFLTHGRLTQEEADDIRSKVRTRQARLSSAPLPEEGGTPELSVVPKPGAASGASDKADRKGQRERAERIAAKHGTPATISKKDKGDE